MVREHLKTNSNTPYPIVIILLEKNPTPIITFLKKKQLKLYSFSYFLLWR